MLGLLLIEGLCSVIWLGIDVTSLIVDGPRVTKLDEETHCEFDDELGWINKPGTIVQDAYGPGRTITINADGVRGAEDYAGKKADGTFRIICLGDSFTLGHGVNDPDTYPRQLQPMLPAGVQTVNMGQGGYSIGQSWLWFKRVGESFKPDLVVCMFIVEDFRRLATNRTANGFGTPQFSFSGERVVVSNVPVPPKLESGNLLLEDGRLLDVMKQDSAIIKTIGQFVPEPLPAAHDGQVLSLGIHILRELRRRCEQIDCPMVLVVTPTLLDLMHVEHSRRYRIAALELSEFASAEDVPFLDLQPAFAAIRHRSDEFFLQDAWQHYSPEGNRLVATEISEWLPTVVEAIARKPAAE